MTKPDDSLFVKNAENQTAPPAASERIEFKILLAHWLTGVTLKKSPTFKDILDNFRNLGTVLTISIVIAAFFDRGGVPILDYIIRYVIGGSFIILLAFLIMQSWALLHLSYQNKNKEEEKLNLYPVVELSFGLIIAFTDAALAAAAGYNIVFWMFRL